MVMALNQKETEINILDQALTTDTQFNKKNMTRSQGCGDKRIFWVQPSALCRKIANE